MIFVSFEFRISRFLGIGTLTSCAPQSIYFMLLAAYFSGAQITLPAIYLFYAGPTRERERAPLGSCLYIHARTALSLSHTAPICNLRSLRAPISFTTISSSEGGSQRARARLASYTYATNGQLVFQACRRRRRSGSIFAKKFSLVRAWLDKFVKWRGAESKSAHTYPAYTHTASKLALG